MAGVEGVVYAVLSDPIASLSSFFPSGSGIRDRALSAASARKKRLHLTL